MGICKECKYLDLDNFSRVDEYWCRVKQEYVYYGSWCRDFTPGGSGGGCYLTSACVDYLGKADDCEELTALRTFRDTYMKSTEEGQKLVEEYYAVAPEIVKKINTDEKKALYYRYISGVVEKCVSLIGLNENKSAMQEYKSMVLFLKKELGL